MYLGDRFLSLLTILRLVVIIRLALPGPLTFPSTLFRLGFSLLLGRARTGILVVVVVVAIFRRLLRITFLLFDLLGLLCLRLVFWYTFLGLVF